jgi:hypothetical protein
MSKRSNRFAILDDGAVATMAHILGDQSAAALALADAKWRREQGEDAVILWNGSTLLVGPRPDGRSLCQGRK